MREEACEQVCPRRVSYEVELARIHPGGKYVFCGEHGLPNLGGEHGSGEKRCNGNLDK